MKISKLLGANLMIALIAVFLFAFNRTAIQEKWEVPDEYNKMQNPMADDEDAMEIGKELFTQHCKSCHGKEGLGDGPKSAELETVTTDFSTEEFQGQTDGAIFYKTTFGRDDMPAFQKKIADDDDRWMLVVYLRSFSE